MTLLTRDNQDILRENIEFHLSQGVDFIILMDHLSTDKTQEIALSYEKLGLLHYINQPSKKFQQADWVTEMARMAKKRYGASWVINNDSDEFWSPLDRRKNLKDIFLELSESTNVLRCERKNFLYPMSDNPSEHFLDTMIYKDTHSLNSLGELLPSKVAHKSSRWIKVGAGNHSVSKIGKQIVEDGDIEIFHFPYRSREQVLSKIQFIGEVVESNHLPENTYTTWKKLHSDMHIKQSIDSYITDLAYTKEQIDHGLSTGRLVKDTSLKDYFTTVKKRFF